MANVMKEMNINEYANAIAMEIGGESRPVEKTNGVVKYGITKMNGSNIAPTIYVEEWYSNDVPVKEAARDIAELIEKNRKEDFDLTQFTEYEKVKGKLQARLYNKATKADIFRKATGFDGLIIVPYINLGDVNNDGTSAFVKVTNGLLQGWGVTAKEVIDTAIKNSKEDISIKSMDAILREMFTGETVEDEDLGINPQMIVLTNRSRMYGAITAMTAKAKLKKMFPNGYVILPSSVHEVIAVPYQPGMENELTGMVNAVNTEEVKPEEILGNKAYVFAA